jgi:glycosyltransferase involved in cell wall biosynthesis
VSSPPPVQDPPPLVVIGPLPPPFHGVTISTALILRSDAIRSAFAVRHLDTSDRRAVSSIGRWDTRNVSLGLTHAAKLAAMLARRRKGIVYLPVSQNAGGFLRDSLFIHAASIAGWRVVIHLRGSEFRSDFYDTSGRVLRWWVRRTLARVASIAVLGESLRTAFDGLVPAERIAVVPNGTPDLPAVSATRDPAHILFLSNLRERKGVVEAVEAALLVTETHSRARFTFAGEIEEPVLIESLARRAAHSSGRIAFVPPVDRTEKAELLMSAGVLLFPPRLPEGHPRVVLEALAAGLPLVTTARGAIPETVRDGIEGFVLRDPDPAALAERVRMLLDDPELHARMSAAARARFLEQYTEAQADRRLVAWLRSVLPPART